MTDSEPGGQSDTGVSIWVLVAIGGAAMVLLSVVVFFLGDDVFDTNPSTTVPKAGNTTATTTTATTTTTTPTTTSTSTLSTTSPSVEGPNTTIGTELTEVTIAEELDVEVGIGSFSAMSNGLICDEGSEAVEIVRSDLDRSDENADLVVEAVFTCADGTGTFTLTLFVVLYPDFTATWDWVVKEGTGSYGGLSGQGTGTGFPVEMPLKHGTYVGQITLG